MDRTGDIEKKRMKRMEVDGVGGEVVGKRVHTFDSLKKDYMSLVREQQEINDKLDKCKNIVNAVQSDDLDAYIQSLKANATTRLDSITRAKLRRYGLYLHALSISKNHIFLRFLRFFEKVVIFRSGLDWVFL